MKRVYHLFIFGVFGLLLTACGSYQSKQQAASLSVPELGGIVATKGSLWFATAEQIGAPLFEADVPVKVVQLPFNKNSYATYSAHMLRASKINGIAYVDSLPYKPKYVRLQLHDKIGLTEILNNTANKNVRSYLENDDAYKLVTLLDITLPDALLNQLVNADKVTLSQNEKGQQALLLTKNKEEQWVAFSEIEVFDHDFSTFCWGEDKYHNKLIKTILTSGENCPKGTFKKATKVRADKSYLKF